MNLVGTADGTNIITPRRPGADTTGTQFQALLIQVLSTPGVYEKLIAELDDATRNKRLSAVPQYAEVVEHCPYYVACVRENMRLTPSAPNIFPRIAPREGLDLDGKFVPGGTELTYVVLPTLLLWKKLGVLVANPTHPNHADATHGSSTETRTSTAPASTSSAQSGG